MTNYFKRETVKLELKPLNGKYVALPGRMIPKDMAEKWGLLYVPDYLGQPCLAATYYKDGQLAGYNIKPKDYDTSRKCYLMGDIKNADMFGSQNHQEPEGRTLVITTGHEDCVIANMVVGDAGYSFTSVKHGDNSVADLVKVHYDKLTRYKSIILCFDMDKSGQEAVKKFLELYNQIGKVKVAKLPYKDANEMYKAGKGKDLKWCILMAETYKPANIIDNIEDMMDEILVKPQMGRKWPWKALTAINHGAYTGRCIIIGGPTNCGKTTLLKDIVSEFTKNDPVWPGALFFLEQKPSTIMHKLISSEVGHDLEQPGNQWWDEERIKEVAKELNKNLFFYDPRQGIELKSIIEAIYYFVNVNKVKFVIIDNLTILASDCKIDGKRVSKWDFYNEVANRLDRLALELDILILVVGHVNKNTIRKSVVLGAKDETMAEYDKLSASKIQDTHNKLGLTAESGRIYALSDIDGGDNAERLFDEGWILSRNSISKDPYERRKLRVDVVKCKVKDKNADSTFWLIYDEDDGRYKEISE